MAAYRKRTPNQRSQRDPVDSNTLERARVQAAWSESKRQGSQGGDKTATLPLTKIERDEELLFVFPDGDRHERRVQRAAGSDADRLFWVTLAIACGAPSVRKAGARAATVAKQYGTLRKARHDLDAFYQYYRPMLIGDPFVVMPGGVGKSPGYFDFTIELDNPTARQLEDSIARARSWIARNQEDPEYTSFQLNFCFSGHGDVNAGNRPVVVLSDGEVETDALASMLLTCIPDNEMVPAQSRLDLYLDCCHSAAIARSVGVHLSDMQAGRDDASQSRLEIGQVYCACLDDEESFELRTLSHSVFTYAFLNECSRKRPEGAESLNLGLRDIGWFTARELTAQGLTAQGQHPLLLDFTCADGFAMKFPAAYYLTHPPGAAGATGSLPQATLDADRFAVDPIGEALRVAHIQRDACAPAEAELARDTSLRTDFSRDEILTNRRFPFL